MSEEVFFEDDVKLACAECGTIFEVSTWVFEAMLHWQNESGDPIICADCCPAEDQL